MRRIADALASHAIPFVVAEQRREAVEALRASHRAAVLGDASEPAVLIQAHIARASMLVVAIPDLFDARKMVEIARTLNPGIRVLVRGDDAAQAALWQQENLGVVVHADAAMAQEMLGQILAHHPAGGQAHAVAGH